MLKINSIKPLFNKIVTTCNLYEVDKTEGNIIVNTRGAIKEYQTVEAVGSTVRDVKVGDVVLINPKRYLVQHHNGKQESLKGVIKDELTLGVNFPMVEYGGKKHLLIYDQDIDYIIDGEEVEEEKTPPIILPKEKKFMA